MKKLILGLMLLLLVPVFASAQEKSEGMKFSGGDFKTVKAEAVKAKKPIFIDIYTTWCPPCKFLSANIFPDSEVGKYMNATFVNTKIDAEKGEGLDIAKTYKIEAYPTMLIVDADGKELGRIVGAPRNPKEFITKVKETLEASKKK